MLPPADRAEEIAGFLSEAIGEHLDAEWLPQECHKEIGEEVARVYREALAQVRQSRPGSWDTRFLLQSFFFCRSFFFSCDLSAPLFL